MCKLRVGVVILHAPFRLGNANYRSRGQALCGNLSLRIRTIQVTASATSAGIVGDALRVLGFVSQLPLVVCGPAEVTCTSR